MGVRANGTTWEVDFSAVISGTPSYTAIGEIVSVDIDGITADVLDASSHGSTWRQKVAGIKDAGSATITVRFGPETHADLLDNIGTLCAHQFTFPVETSTNTTPLSIEWDGIIETVSVNASFEGLLEATVNVALTGAPTITDEAA
jgi:hypothetical protein